MSWDPNFIQDLSDSSIQPKFMLRFNSLPDFKGESLVLSGGFNQLGLPSISDSGPTIRGTSVIPQTWNVSFGSFSVPLVGDIRSLFPTVTRGSIGELFCELNGKRERIAIGQLRNIRGFGVNWRMEFVDILSAMSSRADGTIGTEPEGNDPDRFTLFYLVNKEVNVTANWHNTLGAFPSTISVDDIRPFKKETGETGIAKCVSSGGAEFYVVYSSVMTTVAPAGVLNLSGAHTTSSVKYPSVNACTNLNINDKITSAAILRGKPYEIFGKILLSREGNSVNSFDKYPKSYNFGAYLNESIFDIGDAANQKYIKSSAPATTNYTWGYVVNNEMSDGIRSFIDVTAKTGQWPTWRQDSITWRGCQDPDSSQFAKAYITTKDIIRITNIDIFDPNNKTTFYRSKNIYGINSSGTILSNLKSSSNGQSNFLPAQSIKQRDVRFVYGPDPNAFASDRLKCSIGDLNRMFVWDTNAWSKISLQVKMKYARLTAGDIIEVQSEYLRSFNTENPWTKSHRALVLSVDWNFISSRCNLQIAILIR